jgi:hypothetical protein
MAAPNQDRRIATVEEMIDAVTDGMSPEEAVNLYLKTLGISGPEETEAFLEEIQRRDRETDAKFYEAIGRIKAQVRPA